jgi:hypothetical protein
MFKYQIHTHTGAEWKSQVAVNCPSLISLAIKTTKDILTSLEDRTPPLKLTDPKGQYLGGREIVLSLAADVQAILGDAKDMAMIFSSQKYNASDILKALLHQFRTTLAPHNVYAIRKRTKSPPLPRHYCGRGPGHDDGGPFRHRVPAPPPLVEGDQFPSPPHGCLPIDSIGTKRPLASHAYPKRETTSLQHSISIDGYLSTCFTTHRKTIRFLLKHACNQRRLKNGQTLLGMVVVPVHALSSFPSK